MGHFIDSLGHSGAIFHQRPLYLNNLKSIGALFYDSGTLFVPVRPLGHPWAGTVSCMEISAPIWFSPLDKWTNFKPKWNFQTNSCPPRDVVIQGKFKTAWKCIDILLVDINWITWGQKFPGVPNIGLYCKSGNFHGTLFSQNTRSEFIREMIFFHNFACQLCKTIIIQ